MIFYGKDLYEPELVLIYFYLRKAYFNLLYKNLRFKDSIIKKIKKIYLLSKKNYVMLSNLFIIYSIMIKNGCKG